MKSILHEGTSIVKAIEKAWKESGMPSEFTVNVLEVGEKNFLGLTRRPAVVSITYDPRKMPRGQEKKELSHLGQRGRQATPAPRGRVEQQRAQPQQWRDKEKTQVPVQPYPNQNQKQVLPQQQQQQQRPARGQRQEGSFEQTECWTPDQVNDIKGWFNELLPLMSVKTPFEAVVDDRVLKIIFEQKLFDSRDDERQVFGGMSYLLFQFLKKKYKQKLRGYHLVISSKDHAAGERL